jgi:hypothetical protein
LGGVPVPGEQLGDPPSGVIGDPAEHISECTDSYGRYRQAVELGEDVLGRLWSR